MSDSLIVYNFMKTVYHGLKILSFEEYVGTRNSVLSYPWEEEV